MPSGLPDLPVVLVSHRGPVAFRRDQTGARTAQLGLNMGHCHGVAAAGRLARRMHEMVGSAAPSGGQERHRTGRTQIPLATSYPRPIDRRLPAAEGHQLAVCGALGAALGPPANWLSVHSGHSG